MILAADVYCEHCGGRMLLDGGGFSCRSCDQVHSLKHMANRPPVELHHGERCETCEATGYVWIPDRTFHPYGDTYAAEDTSYESECPDCDGLGYHPRDFICIGCGNPVDWIEDANLDGWHMHDGCLDEPVPERRDP